MAGTFGEFEYIDWITRQLGPFGREVIAGPGDDAAIVDAGGVVAITTDMFTEGTDFDLGRATPEQAGAKALVAATSDIAAMAMRPRFAVVAVNFGKGTTRQLQKGLFRGASEAARRLGVGIVGGDVSAGGDKLVISVTVVGIPGKGPPARRSGAVPSQKIFVTGTLGGAILGRHLAASARIDEALWLGGNVRIGAMIDVSDGLAQDLWHIAKASDVGAVVVASRVPVSADARRLAARTARTALEHALSDGEDFELLFTVASDDAERLCREWPFETKLTRIGWTTDEKGVFLETDQEGRQPLERAGWRHAFE